MSKIGAYEAARMMGETPAQILGEHWVELGEAKIVFRDNSGDPKGLAVGLILLFPSPQQKLNLSELWHGKLLMRVHSRYVSTEDVNFGSGMDLNWLAELGAFDQNNYPLSIGAVDAREPEGKQDE